MQINKMKAAVIGCGMISEAYMKNLKNRFQIIELTACSDLDNDRMHARAGKFGIKAMTFEEILDDPEIELVLNLTNPLVHYSVTKDAVLAKKHVYSEKMIAVTMEQASELCVLAETNNVRIGVAPDTFLGASIQTARELMDRGMIGKPLSFVASLSRDIGIFGDILPHLRKKGGSLPYDTGCYYLTALCSLFGPAEKVTSFSTANNPIRKNSNMRSTEFGEIYKAEVDNVFASAIQYKNGVLGTFHVNADSIYNETRILTIYGTEGILAIEDPNKFGSILSLEKPFGKAAEFPVTHGFEDECRGIGAAEMAWAIRSGRPHRASKEMGTHVLEILHGMEMSAESGQLYYLRTVFDKPVPLPAGFVSREEYGLWSPTEETALV